jgi:hypothetical protein
MRAVLAFATFLILSSRIAAQAPLLEPCAGMEGYASVLCHQNVQAQQPQALTARLHELTESEDNSKQRKIQYQQMEHLGFEDSATVEKDQHDFAENSPEMSGSKSQVFARWASENPWFGPDRTRTEFAMQYAKQLRHEQPKLFGRKFLDAVTAKVRGNFITHN